jgi:hypothetical protein
MKMTNEDITKLARRAAAHSAAGVEGMEINSQAMEKLMWELLLLRKRQENQAFTNDLPPDVSSSYATKTCPGTIRAMRG